MFCVRRVKSLRKFCNRFLPDRLLNMQIMLCHIHICVTHNALDSRKVNTKRLHLRHIGVSAAMRCQHTNSFDVLQSSVKQITKVRRVTRTIRLLLFPDVFLIRSSKQSSAVSDIYRYRDYTITIIRFWSAYNRSTFDHIDSLFDSTGRNGNTQPAW